MVVARHYRGHLHALGWRGGRTGRRKELGRQGGRVAFSAVTFAYRWHMTKQRHAILGVPLLKQDNIGMAFIAITWHCHFMHTCHA